MPRSRRRRPITSGLRRLLAPGRARIVVVTTFAVLVLLALWVVYQAANASVALNRAAIEAETLREALVVGDNERAHESFDRLAEFTQEARESSDGPLWAVASVVPVLGRNAEAISSISRALDDAVTEALPPVLEVSDQISADVFSPRDGQVDLDAMRAVAPALTRGDAALTAAVASLSEIEPNRLLGRLQGPVSTLIARLDDAQIALRASAQGATLMPTMLGGDGVRQYMLLIQSNAEIRGLGGIVGSWAVITADAGQVSMTAQGSTSDILPFDDPVVELSDDELSVFNPSVGADLRNTTVIPHFPRTAEIARQLLLERQGITVDGVVSIDPVALSFLLLGTGPVPLDDGTVLDAGNAVPTLLNVAYAAYPGGAEQNEFFEGAARSVFDAVTAGQGDAPTILRALTQSALENRLLVWTGDDEAQDVIAGTGISGVLTADDGEAPHVGLYLNDSTAAKMQYYLEYGTRTEAVDCRDDRQTIRTHTRIVSNAPANAAELPVSVTGSGALAPRGSMRVVLRFYAPFGGAINQVQVDGQPQTVYAQEFRGRPVSFVQLQIDPGQSFVVTTEMESGAGQTGHGVFSTTPGITSTPNDLRFDSAC